MAQTRPATPTFGVIALILLGGAIATAVGAIMMFASIYQTDVLEGFRHSTGYYALACALIGFFTAIGVMLTRPRGPLAPILAVISAIVALYVGNRLGLLLHVLTHGHIPSESIFFDIMKYTFDVEDLLAPLVAGVIGGLRVAMVAGSLAPHQPPGQPFPQPGGNGQSYQATPGQPPFPGQPPAPGQPPYPGQPPVPEHPPPGQPPPAR